ncbi:efflux RND transporter periplasmic adaptor subunit [Mesorhizobium sp. M1C.F.Ca.ET.193.01.1.1]|uniref:efflux RND transporter periplasmic adaptor subunit n=1 Tax=Mesorhizobium sp. M1C.F.Ca.ET.192.01.1.1 TaxID=2496667 RepID=UPI000FD3479F|nr:efflux RND transporter periplasmic adaptor subunit [Mesorhizobium sp. M1C.F.Ca.ET.192.01.1.1]TGQ54106.1 efflux RND transporter periplasmic adaptor subunit [Mesorhizobium sp. M1C.F.Ca.ET.210.01.1.1]TGQ72120.1 efflux RND transporter periplasmic adaptor subunit [Mesorhizobium sp. M1C.F.Ca.ET.212.01.1.1]TGR09935.1 efflux RND transporter periplasmic adaptor subunit [Mesorhizobium sp. M1C.F.Ca.ET.204.01.1.1]TGR30055.1 efflux RND transporter periplasmic adaptor subunit [Mesorhizobium sp. M1C.F.Ca.E
MARKLRKRHLLLLALLVAVAAVAALKAYGRATPEPAAQAPARAATLTVSVETVGSRAVTSSVSATGTISAWQEATIGAEESSLRLTAVLVKEGDHVKAGDVVARLDDSLLKAQLAEQKAAVAQAQATLDSALSAAARADKLLASHAVSAETAEEKATAVKTGKAGVEQAEAATERLQAQLDRTTIRAPFDGIVSSKPAVAGSIVQAGTELMKIVRDGRLEVGVLVPEKDLAAISVGQTTTIVDASGRTFSGSVSSIAETVNSTTRLATVYVGIGEGSGLKPGMFARVAIETAASRQLTVAEAALVWHGGKPAVFVVDDKDKVSARSVVTGARQNGRVAIESGLSEGDHVVVAGAGFLNDGNLVRVAAIEAKVDNAATESAQ